MKLFREVILAEIMCLIVKLKPVNRKFSLIFSMLACLSMSYALVSTPVAAKEFQCSSGPDNRYVRMEYPGTDHLCEVTVTRSDESRKVMWYADNDSNFCSEKILELVGKYRDRWGFYCEEWPDRDGVDALSQRHRQVLDEVIKQTMLDANDTVPPFTVLGTRALVGPLALKTSGNSINPPIDNGDDTGNNSGDDDKRQSPELFAIQLFMTKPVNEYSDSNTLQDSLSPTNRLLFIRDDGINLDTFATLDELKDLIEIDEDGYLLDSAIIEKILPGGEIEVSTLVSAPQDSPDDVPSCYGRKLFKPTGSGLQSIGKHKFICNF